MLHITNEDNMQLMAQYPDKYFDLAIVDPPYGIMDRMYQTNNNGGRNKSTDRFAKHIKQKRWDEEKPDKIYFKELFRVSKNQLIWGGNYFALPPTRCVIAWDKMVYAPSMSQIEMCWTSFDSPARLVKIDNNDKNRIHPTQKPVALYKWLLTNYANPGDKILDTHLGSGSIAIACHDLGFDLTACELDADYYAAAMQRINAHVAQQSIFTQQEKQEIFVQKDLFE